MIVCDCFGACVGRRRCLFVFLLVFVGVLLFLLVCVWKGSVAIFSFVCTYIWLCMSVIQYLSVLVWRARRFMDVLFDYVCLGPYAKRSHVCVLDMPACCEMVPGNQFWNGVSFHYVGPSSLAFSLLKYFLALFDALESFDLFCVHLFVFVRSFYNLLHLQCPLFLACLLLFVVFFCCLPFF